MSRSESQPGARFHAALTALAQLDKSDLESALRDLVRVGAEEMEVARVSYWELSADHTQITNRVLFSLADRTFGYDGQLESSQFPAYFRALLECHAIVADDAWTDPRTCEFVDAYFRPHGIRSMLDIPVWRRGKLAGVLCHEHVGSSPRAWTAEEQSFASGVGNMVSSALEAGDRRRAEEGYALVARATSDVLWDWDMRTNRLEWNDVLYDVFRYDRSEVPQQLGWWIEHVHPDDRSRVQAKLERTIASGASAFSDQYRFCRGDGTVATVIDRGHVVRDSSGVAVRMIGSMLDITERVEMQARLALSDRMASIGTLAAGVAHEINNPLTYVLANLTLALEETRQPSMTAESMRSMLREAHEGAERVRRIVRDLQVFSRPAAEDVENVEVHAVLESSLNMAWNEIRHRARVEKDYGPVPNVRMNRARLGQVILNLLINAAQSIQEGNANSHVIRIRTATTAQGAALIEVTDTGCGISAEVRNRIFEPFFTTKPVGFGTGLGLSICHSIIASAGGQIDVDSALGSGTTMRVRLPAGQAPVALPIVAAAPQPRRRVLLVDDEAPIRRVIARLLGPNHDVSHVESAEHALTEVAQNNFDIILCDLMMPTMSGMEMYRRLQERDEAAAARVVFMTGGVFSPSAADFLRSCGRPYVEKPIDRAALAQAFADVGA